MDVFDTSIIRLWQALNSQGVQYIMVGGYATNIHGFQRFTGDLDIWLHDTLPNRKKLRQALNELGLGDLEMIEYMQFVPGWTEFRLDNGMPIDILTTMRGLEAYTFEECLSIATIAEIENTAVPFLHINQLILNKKTVNRPKDAIDILELEKIKKLRDEQ